MNHEGPQLESLLHRLSECPAEFLETCITEAGKAQVIAIASDHFRDWVNPDSNANKEYSQDRIESLSITPKNSERLWGLISVATWLLHDEWFLARPELAKGALQWLNSDTLEQLANINRPEQFVRDPDRREELVRLCLDSMELRPRGESIEQAMDRKQTLDSVERSLILRETAEMERRAREVREAMAKKRALESASRYGE